MRNIFRGNRVEQRRIIQNAKHITYPDIQVDIYISEDNGIFEAQLFKGKRTKADLHYRSKNLPAIERKFEDKIEAYKIRKQRDELYRQQKKERNKKLKEELVPGALLRTSFSYNMTFNHFYKVLSNKRSTYKLEVVDTNWVDGDIGWTGNVKAGEPTGKIIEGKFTANGLKIDGLYAKVINPEDTFYENHMD